MESHGTGERRMDYNSQNPLVAFPLSSLTVTLKFFAFVSPQTLYSTLPALLDSNPFTAGAELPGPGAELEAMPPGLRPTLGVFQAALELTSQCELHPDLVSQTFGYLFFFSNASLLNSLMERGEGWAGSSQAQLWVASAFGSLVSSQTLSVK